MKEGVDRWSYAQACHQTLPLLKSVAYTEVIRQPTKHRREVLMQTMALVENFVCLLVMMGNRFVMKALRSCVRKE